jgi:glycosyltransferase involved in cell wall biosynthesis
MVASEKRLRILHSIRSVNPVGGGPIEGLKQMASLSAALGHSVDVVSLDDPNDPWVKTCPVPCHALGPAWLKYGYSSRLVPWLRSHAHTYDAVVVNGIWQYNAFGVWRALRNTAVPYFVYTHGMLDPWFKRSYPIKHLKKWFYWPWGDYRVLRDASAVLFTCEQERLLARQSFWLYRCNEFVVNYGTSGPVGDPAQQVASFLARFPQLKDKRCLLFLGRVHVKKGPDLLLRAFAQVLRDFPPALTRDLHLVMAGPNDHDFGAEMRQLSVDLRIDHRIVWTGMVTGDMKWGAFRVAEAFILPSHQENFGISVAEALACSLPVLISDQVNIWREIAEDGAGLVEKDDLPGTIHLLERWLNTSPAERLAMGRKAKASYHLRFSADEAAASLIRVIERFGLKQP